MLGVYQMIVQGLNPRDAPVLLLAIYQVVTGSCVFTNKTKKVTVSNKFICLIKFAFVVEYERKTFYPY